MTGGKTTHGNDKKWEEKDVQGQTPRTLSIIPSDRTTQVSIVFETSYSPICES